MQIIHGLPEGHEAAAAALYWEAFGAKLGKLLGPLARVRKGECTPPDSSKDAR